MRPGKIEQQLRQERAKAREKAIQKEAEKMHKQMQADIKKLYDPKKGPEYQDYVNVWMLKKLAELSLEVKASKSKSLLRG